MKIQTDAEQGTFFDAGHTSGVHEEIVPSFSLSGLLVRAVTLAIVANEDLYEVYVDEKKVGDGRNGRITPASNRSFGCCHMEATNLAGGTMRIAGIRMYDLP